MQANRLFVLESVSAFAAPTDTPPSLLSEGWGMLSALLMDLAQTGRFALTTLLHPRLRPALSELIETCPELTGVSVDWVAKADSTDPLTNGDKHALLRTVLVTCESALLIAPEINGELTELARLAESLGVRLVSPGSDCCRLFSDKLQTADHLTRSVPSQLIPPSQGSALDVLNNLVTDAGWQGYPRFVIKPIDGAGSDGVYVGSIRQLADRLSALIAAEDGQLQPTERMLLQPYIAGLPASIALCRSRTGKITILPPCQQLISESADGNLAYRGSQLLTDHNQIARCQRLADEYLKSAPPSDWVGYLGLDLVLADSADGSCDTIIEVNPRLTTSYLCYRAMRHLGNHLPFDKPLINLVLGDDG